MKSNTIAAISTAQGAGGIGVIRISGEKAKAVADKVFHSAGGKKLSEMKGYTALYGKVAEGGEAIDEAVALVFCAPHSYTGEDVVELSCHGGMYLCRRVLHAVLRAGARAAEPGEFTRRAFLNGKMDLAEAESVMDLIGAKGRQAARVALAGREGALSGRIKTVKEALVSSAAHLSAWADYPEEDIPQVDAVLLKTQLQTAKKELLALLHTYGAGKAVREGVDTVIAGRPNVGKSALMNLLSGCERSIVTDIPGTTRDVVEETVLLGDVALRLSDTAGIRETIDPVERIGVGRAKQRLLSAELVLAVFDASQPLTEDDKGLIQSIGEAPAVAVVNKTDLESKIDVEYIQKFIKHIVYISALKGEGLNQLTETVSALLHTDRIDPAAGVLSSERQYAAVREAVECIEEAVSALELGFTLDAVTVSIEGAVNSLCELTGERASEAVVHSVFSRFCVGK